MTVSAKKTKGGVSPFLDEDSFDLSDPDPSPPLRATRDLVDFDDPFGPGAFASDSSDEEKKRRNFPVKSLVAGLVVATILGGAIAAFMLLPLDRWLNMSVGELVEVIDASNSVTGALPPAETAAPATFLTPPGMVDGGSNTISGPLPPSAAQIAQAEADRRRRPWLKDLVTSEAVPLDEVEPPQAESAPITPPAIPEAPPAAPPVAPESADRMAESDEKPETVAILPPPLPEPAPAPASIPAPPPEHAVAVPALPAIRPASERPDLMALADRPQPSAPLREGIVRALHRRGGLPVISGSGQEARVTYARPFEKPDGMVTIAVLVTNLGLRKEITDAAIMKLPPDVSLGFSAYSEGTKLWVDKAWKWGHEVVLTLPTEIAGYPEIDPGPLALLKFLSLEDNQIRFERALSRMAGYAGVTTYLPGNQSVFIESPKMAPVLTALKDRGLFYVGAPAPSDAVPAMVEATEIADETPFAAAIQARLDRAMDIAQKDGQALIVVGPHPVSLALVARWIDGFAEHGAVLAPVSALVKPPEGK